MLKVRVVNKKSLHEWIRLCEACKRPLCIINRRTRVVPGSAVIVQVGLKTCSTLTEYERSVSGV